MNKSDSFEGIKVEHASHFSVRSYLLQTFFWGAGLSVLALAIYNIDGIFALGPDIMGLRFFQIMLMQIGVITLISTFFPVLVGACIRKKSAVISYFQEADFLRKKDLSTWNLLSFLMVVLVVVSMYVFVMYSINTVDLLTGFSLDSSFYYIQIIQFFIGALFVSGFLSLYGVAYFTKGSRKMPYLSEYLGGLSGYLIIYGPMTFFFMVSAFFPEWGLIILVLYFVLLYVFVRTSFISYICIENPSYPLLRAFKTSWTITKGNFRSIIGMGIVTQSVIMAGIIRFVIGLGKAIPLVGLGTFSFYESCKKEKGIIISDSLGDE